MYRDPNAIIHVARREYGRYIIHVGNMEVFPYTYKVRTFSSRLAELVRVGLECFKSLSILIPRQKKKKGGRERKRGQDAGGVWYGMVAFVHNRHHHHHHHKILYIIGRDEMMTSGNSARRVGICGSPFLGMVREGRCSIISHIARRQIPVYSHGLMEIVMAGDAEYIRNPVGMDHGRGNIVDYSKLQTRMVLYRKMRAGVGSIILQLRAVRPLHVSLPLPLEAFESQPALSLSMLHIRGPRTTNKESKRSN